MARPLAANYEDKRRAILKSAAALFAVQGYDRASMNEIAAHCGVSKALLYHYYDNKEHLLFDIIHAHLDDLVAVVDVGEGDPRARLRAMIGGLLEAYQHADEEHQIQISGMKRLPIDRVAELIALERVLVRAFSEAISALHPALKTRPNLLKPITMNLFGMMNWKFMWFREDGPISHEAYSDLVMTMLDAGAREALAAG